MAEGPAGPNFSVYFSTASTALVAIVLMVTGTMAVVSLRSESVGRTGAMALGRGFHSSAGVLSAQSFEQAVTDHLQRAVCDQVGLAVIEANLENLPAINLVFGRGSGDEAIRRFASTVRRIVPVLAVIGHWSPGRFLVLVRVDNAAEAQRIGARIQTALIDDPLAELHHIRLTASVGTADTFTGGYSLAELMAIAEAAVQKARAAAVGAQLAANESYLT
jgi:diguanylate cyclase (GGDEF)-like protein